jgi:PadR family transcriptional regulator PadR
VKIEDWTIQLKKGTLEYCILLLIRETPCYGYEIVSKLSEWPIVSAKESTVYPLLKRLQKEGLLGSFWQDTVEGLPPRKYYSITDEGNRSLDMMSGEWDSLTRTLTDIRNKQVRKGP